MNRNLVIFSLFLVLIGVAFDLYLVAFFGLLILLPAFFASSKPSARTPGAPQTPQPKQAPRRIIPRAAAKPEPAPTSTAQPMAAPEYSAPTYHPSYTPALFPSPMLPTLSQMPTTSTPVPKAASETKQGVERDELVEAGAILAVLKLLFG